MNTTYKKATLGSRFLAIFIDLIILGILASILTTIITMAAKIEAPEFKPNFSENVENFLVDFVNENDELAIQIDEFGEEVVIYIATFEYDDLIEYAASISGSPTVSEIKVAYSYCQNYYKEATTTTIKQLAITLAVTFVLFIIYYPIIGALWRRQTIGRFIAGIKVIDSTGYSPTFSKLIVRDVIGFYLFNLLNFCCFVPLIVNIVLLAGAERCSVGDKMSNTIVVCVDRYGNPIELDNNNSNNFNQYQNRVVDADIVDSTVNSQSPLNSTDENSILENQEDNNQGV